MSTSEVVLAIEGLVRRFGRTEVVRGLSMEVRGGEIYGLLGLNGAGKTTTLRMVLGLLRRHGGRIELLGRPVDPRRPEHRRGVGALVEGPAYFPPLSAAENVALIGSLGERPVTRAEARRLLDQVGLAAAADRPVRAFSLGMKQRLGIALALVGDPRLVILDEPSNGLDPQGMREIRELIVRQNRERGTTFVISSHLLHEVQQICHRVGIVHEGRMVAEGRIDELEDPGRSTLLITVAPAEDARRRLAASEWAGRLEPDAAGRLRVRASAGEAPAINRFLVEGGLDVSALVPEKASLEDLFFARAGAALGDGR